MAWEPEFQSSGGGGGAVVNVAQNCSPLFKKKKRRQKKCRTKALKLGQWLSLGGVMMRCFL